VAKTIPLRRISAGSFLQGFKRRTRGLWREAQFRGLYSLADVSICWKFLRIDNAKIITEAATMAQWQNQPPVHNKDFAF
jgi:hypothetical protein